MHDQEQDHDKDDVVVRFLGFTLDLPHLFQYLQTSSSSVAAGFEGKDSNV